MDQNFIELINQRSIILAQIEELQDKIRIVQQHKIKQFTQLEEDYLQAGEILEQIQEIERQENASCIPCCEERKKIKLPQRNKNSKLDYRQIEKDLNSQLNEQEKLLEGLEQKLMMMAKK